MNKQENNIEQINKQSQLLSIKNWLINSWELFKISWVGITAIYILSTIALLVSTVIVGLLFLPGLLSYLPDIIKTQDFQPLFDNLINFIPNVLIFFLIVAILNILNYFISNILIVSFIDSKDRNIKINYLQKFKSTLIPFILLSVLSFIIFTGSLFAFIIPFFIILIFTTFANYELIVENVKPIQAIRNSFRIVSQNFSDFMIRYAIIIVAYITIRIVVLQAGDIGQLINNLISIIMTLFTYVINFVLYRQLRANTDMNKPQSLKWVWVATVIGWIGIISMFALTFQTITSVVKNANFQNINNFLKVLN